MVYRFLKALFLTTRIKWHSIALHIYPFWLAFI